MEMFESKFGKETFRTTLHPGSCVMIERIRDSTVVDVKLFAVGSIAAYDQVNLTYYGPIDSIGKKTITVKTKFSDSLGFTKKYRLKPEKFAMLNWDFDLNTASSKNSEIMSYL